MMYPDLSSIFGIRMYENAIRILALLQHLFSYQCTTTTNVLMPQANYGSVVKYAKLKKAFKSPLPC